MAKPKFILHIVGGRELFLHQFVRWSKGVMFVKSHFANAQSLCNGLHCPTSFGKVRWQPYHVPLGFRAVNLQHQCAMSHTMPYIIQWLLYACYFFRSVWARKGVIQFVGLIWVAFGTGCRVEIEFSFGGTKQNFGLQGTILGVKFVLKTLCPWIRLHGLCHWPWISTLGNSFKLQSCWIMAYTSGPTFQAWLISQFAWRLETNYQYKSPIMPS